VPNLKPDLITFDGFQRSFVEFIKDDLITFEDFSGRRLGVSDSPESDRVDFVLQKVDILTILNHHQRKIGLG
jgi:hypothetical protein